MPVPVLVLVPVIVPSGPVVELSESLSLLANPLAAEPDPIGH